MLFRNRLKRYGTVFVSCSDLASKWMFPNVKDTEIVKVNNGINLNLFRFNNETRMEQRKKITGGDKAFIIGHVGRFSYVKNHDYIIEIFSRINTKIPNARLLLIGDGKLKEVIQNKVKELGLDNSVIFYGICPNVNEILQAMDVFLLPSFSEGFPIVGVF